VKIKDLKLFISSEF